MCCRKPFTFFASLQALVSRVIPNPALENVLVTGALALQLALTSLVSALDLQQIQALNKAAVKCAGRWRVTGR